MSSSTMDRTTWSVAVQSPTTGSATATLSVSLNGGTPQDFLMQGVCYSPCPINASNGNAPNLGDWFWDSYAGTGYSITGWEALWGRDLPNLRALGANTLRVYSMLSRQLNTNGSYPQPWNSGHHFTHASFLDQCWNGGTDPLYVLVGIPLPQQMFWQSLYQQTPQDQIDFWTGVLAETVREVAHHPAVLGVIIQNEQDSSVVTYGSDTSAVEFWWSQVEAMAAIAKAAAPDKLVGMAVHDDPNICANCQSYMAACPSLDFWGVNTYQTLTFEPVFGPTPSPGYSGLTGAALKPVVLTEWGIPATGHQSATDPSTIYADATTESNTAAVLATMLPQAFGAAPPSPQPAYPAGLCLGVYYFEYCDEWWNQAPCSGWQGPPNIYTWWGGCPAGAFPNGYWDQEGFGVYSVQRGAGLANNAPTWVQNGGTGGPNTPIDVLTERTAIATALQNAFAAAAIPS